MNPLQSIGHGFANLLNFSGRDDRAAFWPYALVIFVLSVIAGALVFGPPFQATMDAMLAYAVAHPDQAQVQSGPGEISINIQGFHPELFSQLGSAMVPLVAVMLATEALLAAAVARRLRDHGRSPWWGLLPVI